VIPDDVQALAIPVLAHRMLPSTAAVVGREMPDRILAAIVQRLPLPGR
jgi:MoxR-like ATPase